MASPYDLPGLFLASPDGGRTFCGLARKVLGARSAPVRAPKEPFEASSGEARLRLCSGLYSTPQPQVRTTLQLHSSAPAAPAMSQQQGRGRPGSAQGKSIAACFRPASAGAGPSTPVPAPGGQLVTCLKYRAEAAGLLRRAAPRRALQLACIACVLPVLAACVERGFSRHRLVKTRLSSRKLLFTVAAELRVGLLGSPVGLDALPVVEAAAVLHEKKVKGAAHKLHAAVSGLEVAALGSDQEEDSDNATSRLARSVSRRP
jgi:hypothetical protein